MSFPLPFIFFPTIRIISHGFFFTIKLLFSWPCWPPSLNQLRDQGPVAAIPACSLPAEGGGREFPLPFSFSPPFQLFLMDSFLQLYCSLPSVYQGTSARHYHPRAACCMGKPVTVSFPLVLNFPLCSNFSHSISSS